jgi:hypothetical protein
LSTRDATQTRPHVYSGGCLMSVWRLTRRIP